jgi:hypothetical protein
MVFALDNPQGCNAKVSMIFVCSNITYRAASVLLGRAHVIIVVVVCDLREFTKK